MGIYSCIGKNQEEVKHHYIKGSQVLASTRYGKSSAIVRH